MLNYFILSSFFRLYANDQNYGVCLQTGIIMPYLYHYGTQEQIHKYLPDIMAGRKLGSIAMTEPAAGR